MLSGLVGDLRTAVRGARSAPAVALAAALTLALGVGAVTTIFSVADALTLRDLPVREPRTLVTITSQTALQHGFRAGVGWNYDMWRQLSDRASAFDGAFAWMLQRLDRSEGGEVQPATVLFASGGFFETLGVGAHLGRTITTADDVPGVGPQGAVTMVSHDFWQHRLNAARDVVGSRLMVEGTPVTVVGVAPEGFRGVDVGQPFDLMIPFGADRLIRGNRSLIDSKRALLLTVIVRLKPAQTIAAASSALQAMQPDIVGPDAPPFLREPFLLVPASTGISDRSQLRQNYEYPLVILAIVAGTVLAIACVNIANLLFARAASRRHELSVRIAAGAPHWRLVRLTTVEGLVLGAVGSLAAVLLAGWGSRALVSQLSGPGGDLLLDVPLDWRVLAFSLVVTLTAVAVFSLGPALLAGRVAPIEVLREGRATNGRRTGALSLGLLASQLAFSFVLVAFAGLFVRTATRLADVPLGFDPRGILVATVGSTRAGAAAPAADLPRRVIDAVGAVHGVERAAGSIWIPLGTGGGGLLIDARGRRAAVDKQVGFNFVTPGWFAVYRTRVAAGRDFAWTDDGRAPRVAIVNETLRRTLTGDAPIIGTTINAGTCGKNGCTVVGVVEDAVYGRSLRDVPPPTVYLPLAQSAGAAPPGAPLRVSLRASGDLAPVTAAVAAALRDVDPRLTFGLRRFEQDVDASLAQERLVARLAGVLGVLGLLLSAVGLYGITWHSVARRRREIGVRLALGGQPSTVARALVVRIAIAAVVGTTVGLMASLWLSRFVAPLLFGLGPRDPATLAAAALVLVVVAFIAAAVPSIRAARVDPATVLREH